MAVLDFKNIKSVKMNTLMFLFGLREAAMRAVIEEVDSRFNTCYYTPRYA